LTAEERTAEHFRWQAAACRELGSELYGALLDYCADDLLAGGQTAVVLAQHLERRRRDAIALRLLAGVHSIVLTGGAPELATYYPSVGGRRAPARSAWEPFHAVLVNHADAVRKWLDHAPQTNEVGRAAALAGGLRHLAAEAPLPIRLVEIGASAGLNLRADRFRIAGRSASSGPASSPLVLADAWLGAAPPAASVEVVERLGVDLAPIDPSSEDGRLRLMAFVWADQVGRMDRLRGAFEVARLVPAELRAGDAVAATRELQLTAGHWTLLWHSVFRQYLDDDAHQALVAAIAALGAAASDTARFAHLMLEPDRTSAPDAFPVTLTTWPGGKRRVLGTAPAHGLPVTWTDLSG
jgi:hypothetical protein